MIFKSRGGINCERERERELRMIVREKFNKILANHVLKKNINGQLICLSFACNPNG